MGTKRVGLARIEALMENLKREYMSVNEYAKTQGSGKAIEAAGQKEYYLSHRLKVLNATLEYEKNQPSE